MTHPQSPTEALLPCPFCGGRAILTEKKHYSTVQCGNEHCPMDFCCSKAERAVDAVAAWNRRGHTADAHPQQPSGWRDIAPDTGRLRELLEKATPGQWTAIGSAGYVQSGPGHPKQTILAVAYGHDGNHQFNAPGSRENGEYIAACNPEAIRALIDELDMLRAIHRAHPAEQQEGGDAAEEAPRYVVLKASGSRFAYVNDTQEGKTVKRYDILKGDGWEHAVKHAERLNRAAMTGGKGNG